MVPELLPNLFVSMIEGIDRRSGFVYVSRDSGHVFQRDTAFHRGVP
jgi:hypothetical protein